MRDGSGGPIPDRKPCLKVSLSLPVISTANAKEFFALKPDGSGFVYSLENISSSGLKKVSPSFSFTFCFNCNNLPYCRFTNVVRILRR